MKHAVPLIALFAALTGCSTARPLPALQGLDLGTNPRVLNFPVPFVEQTPKLCGPSALLMAVKAYRPDLTIDEVARITFTPGALGTYKQDFLSGARRLGFAPYAVFTPYEMIEHLARRRPVVVFHSTGFLWKNFWHYSVLTGYDVARETFYLHIGPYPNLELPMSKVIGSWTEGGRWSYVLLPAKEIPELATAAEALENGTAFLRIGQLEAARRLAEAAVARWSEDFRPEVLLADVLSREKETALAVLHLRRALKKDPGNALLRLKVEQVGGAPRVSTRIASKTLARGAQKGN